MQAQKAADQFEGNQGGLLCPMPLYFRRDEHVSHDVGCSMIINSGNIDIGLISTLEQIRNMFELRLKQQLAIHQTYIQGVPQEETKKNSTNKTLKAMVKKEEEEDDNNMEETRNTRKTKSKPTTNDTKNIPKNFGKAIISFIQRNQEITRRCLNKYGLQLSPFLQELKMKKKCLHSIFELRSLWIESEFKYAKVFRELSFYFLRRATFKYIFGSRIADFGSHLKYRYRIIKALENPASFNSIKM